MSFKYSSVERNVILKQLAKNNFSKSDLCRMLDVSQPTIDCWIKDPGLIRLRELNTIAGLFGINVLELVYLLERTKPVLKKADKWYIENVKLNADTLEG